MRTLFRTLVRVGAFVSKEMLEILRQPRLVLLLVFGPFAILALFGVGYLGRPAAFRTLFVADPGSALAPQIPDYARAVSPQLAYVGITSDQNQALEALRRGEVDLVIIAPQDVEEAIRNNRQATFVVYHNEIDPLQADYIRYFGNTIVESVNRFVLESAAAEGQLEAGDAQADLQSARENAARLRQAAQAGDAVAAAKSRQALDQDLEKLSLALAASAGTLAANASDRDALNQALQAVMALRQDNSALQDPQAERISGMEEKLAQMETQLKAFRSVSPDVLVSPFVVETRSVARVQPSMVTYFLPAVLALLLQHLAVTLAALSLVREQQLGIMEWFRVSPVSAGEMLLGKYLSYMLFQGVLIAVLTALALYGLGMTMLGDWWEYVAVAAAVSFTSLGYGFVISTLSQTDSQAVQFTMLVLLVSVFFSGFFMSLGLLAPWLHGLSWALPVTYGIDMLRNIMLRGPLGAWSEFVALVGIGAALAVLAWALLRRQMRRA